MRVPHPVPQFGQRGVMDIQHHQDAYRHEQQGDGEQRIDFTDDFIHRQQGGEDVIQEHRNNPERHIQRLRREFGEQPRRSCDEHGAHQYHQYHGEHPHHLFCRHPQIASDDFRQAFPAVPDGQHAGQVVVRRAGENAPQHDPQIGRRAELRPHDGPEYRSQSCNVQKLNHKDFPRRHRDIIHPVRFCHRRRRTRGVRSENALHDSSVDEITGNQRR